MWSIRHSSVVALVVAGLVFGAGCGSSSNEAQEVSDPAPNGATAAPDGSGSGDSQGGGDEEMDADIPEIADGAWQGTLHVDVTGDVSSSFDAPGTGSTLDGFTNVAFTVSDGGAVSFALGGDMPPALSLGVEGFGTSATLGEDCSITFTKSDATNLAADFECPKLQAVDRTTTVKTVSAEGNFTMTRPA